MVCGEEGTGSREQDAGSGNDCGDGTWKMDGGDLSGLIDRSYFQIIEGRAGYSGAAFCFTAYPVYYQFRHTALCLAARRFCVDPGMRFLLYGLPALLSIPAYRPSPLGLSLLR